MVNLAHHTRIYQFYRYERVPKSIWNSFFLCHFTSSPLLNLVLNLVGGLYVQEYNKIMNEVELSVKFQLAAEADNSPAVVKNLFKKANERNMPLLEYITETGPEMREIFDRMLAAEAKFRIQQ